MLLSQWEVTKGDLLFEEIEKSKLVRASTNNVSLKTQKIVKDWKNGYIYLSTVKMELVIDQEFQ